MKLRAILRPRKIDEADATELRRTIMTIAAAPGERAKAESLHRFHEITGALEYDMTFFNGADWGMSVEEFIDVMTNAEPQRVPDITKEELAQIVRRVRAEDGPLPSEADTRWYLKLLERNLPHPEVSDLIFWPPKHLENASAEQIVEAALAYEIVRL